jgi:hypothetical protein
LIVPEFAPIKYEFGDICQDPITPCFRQIGGLLQLSSRPVRLPIKQLPVLKFLSLAGPRRPVWLSESAEVFQDDKSLQRWYSIAACGRLVWIAPTDRYIGRAAPGSKSNRHGAARFIFIARVFVYL